MVSTVENLLYGLVAHLRGGEALQRHDGGVGPVAQEQLAGLDVAGQRRPVQSRLPERVHGVHLESEAEERDSRRRFLAFYRERKKKGEGNDGPSLRVSAAPPGCRCEPSLQPRAGES